jgi:hypothetical protein
MFSPPNTNLFRLGEVVKLKLAVNCRNEATWDFVKLETLLRPSTLLHQTQIKYSSRVLRRICTLQQRNTRFELNEKKEGEKKRKLTRTPSTYRTTLRRWECYGVFSWSPDCLS